MVSKVAVLVLAYPLPTGPLCFFMSCVFEILFLIMENYPPLFIYRQVKRTISRIFELLDVKFGSILLVFKQRDSRTPKPRVGVFKIRASFPEQETGKLVHNVQ